MVAEELLKGVWDPMRSPGHNTPTLRMPLEPLMAATFFFFFWISIYIV